MYRLRTVDLVHVRTKTPKESNLALRKIAKARLTNGKDPFLAAQTPGRVRRRRAGHPPGPDRVTCHPWRLEVVRVARARRLLQVHDPGAHRGRPGGAVRGDLGRGARARARDKEAE